jgi:hypothetical protein
MTNNTAEKYVTLFGCDMYLENYISDHTLYNISDVYI